MIYLDHNATTIAHVRVREMLQELMQHTYNASSIHSKGREAKAIIEQARNRVAKLLNINGKSREYQIIFTASGTEANNMIISSFKDADIFVSATEHLSILALKDYYPNIKVIKVDKNGLIDLGDLERLLQESRNDKKLISVMLANNETGVIQKLKNIVELAQKFGALVHSDIVQAVGKIKVDLTELGVDFATISGHKFGGILGGGALIAKTVLKILPMIVGGGQEGGLRAGSENIFAIAGMGLAASIVEYEFETRHAKMKQLQSRLEGNLLGAKIVAKDVMRLPNTSLIIAPYKLDAMMQLISFDLQGIAVSSGAACSSGKVGNSHVLKAMGVNASEASSAIRVSVSCDNSFEDIDRFINVYNQINGQRDQVDIVINK